MLNYCCSSPLRWPSNSLDSDPALPISTAARVRRNNRNFLIRTDLVDIHFVEAVGNKFSEKTTSKHT